jgi:adenosylhomocysteine nucleosidase
MAGEIRTIAILSAMPSELAPIRRVLGLGVEPQAGPSYVRGVYKGVTVITAVTKMGLAAAQKATEELFTNFGADIDHLFVVGIAGAYDPGLNVGDVLTPEFVVDERDGVARYPVNLSESKSSGVIYSTDQLCYDKTFVAMLRSRNVSLVDMESGAIAAVCERNNCPFTIIRAVSDRVDKHAEKFDVFHLANDDGSPRYFAAIRYVLSNPRKIFYLAAMGLGAKKAINASSSALLKNVERLLSRE